MKHWHCFFILTGLIWALPGFGQESDVRSKSGDSISFQHGEVERSYLIHLPEDLEPNAPLVFLLHGYRGKAKRVMRKGMNRLANQHGFAVFTRRVPMIAGGVPRIGMPA